MCNKTRLSGLLPFSKNRYYENYDANYYSLLPKMENPFVIIFCGIVANAVGQDRNLDYVGFITPIIWQLINPSFRSSVRQDDHIYHSKPPHQRDDNSSRDLLFLHVCYPRKLYDHNHAFMIDARLAIALKDRSFQCWLV